MTLSEQIMKLLAPLIALADKLYRFFKAFIEASERARKLSEEIAQLKNLMEQAKMYLESGTLTQAKAQDLHKIVQNCYHVLGRMEQQSNSIGNGTSIMQRLRVALDREKMFDIQLELKENSSELKGWLKNQNATVQQPQAQPAWQNVPPPAYSFPMNPNPGQWFYQNIQQPMGYQYPINNLSDKMQASLGHPMGLFAPASFSPYSPGN